MSCALGCLDGVMIAIAIQMEQQKKGSQCSPRVAGCFCSLWWATHHICAWMDEATWGHAGGLSGSVARLALSSNISLVSSQLADSRLSPLQTACPRTEIPKPALLRAMWLWLHYHTKWLWASPQGQAGPSTWATCSRCHCLKKSLDQIGSPEVPSYLTHSMIQWQIFFHPWARRPCPHCPQEWSPAHVQTVPVHISLQDW